MYPFCLYLHIDGVRPTCEKNRFGGTGVDALPRPPLDAMGIISTSVFVLFFRFFAKRPGRCEEQRSFAPGAGPI